MGILSELFYILPTCYLFNAPQLTKTVRTARLGLEFVFLFFLGCMICLYVGVCFVLPWTVESFPFMLALA